MPTPKPADPNPTDRTIRAARFRRPIWAKLASHAEKHVLVADLSNTGMRIIDPMNGLDIGEHVDLEIHADGMEPFTVAGAVSRLTADGFAVQFAVALEETGRWSEFFRRLTSA